MFKKLGREALLAAGLLAEQAAGSGLGDKEVMYQKARADVEFNIGEKSKISAADWEFAAKQNRKQLEDQYAILPDKGKTYDRLREIYDSLKGHSQIPDNIKFHLIRPRLNHSAVATDVATRDEGNNIYFVDDFISELDKHGLLKAVMAHELTHGVDDGKRMAITKLLKVPQEIKDELNWKREADVDYRAAVALFEAGDNPEIFMDLLKFMREKSWLGKEQFDIRASRIRQALDALDKVKQQRIHTTAESIPQSPADKN